MPKAITRLQAERVQVGIDPSLRYLRKLKVRMKLAGFNESDELFVLVCKAHEAVQAVFAGVQRIATGGRVGSDPTAH